MIIIPLQRKPSISEAIRLNFSHPVLDQDSIGVFLPRQDQRFVDLLHGVVSSLAGATTPLLTLDEKMGVGREGVSSSTSREDFSGSDYALLIGDKFSIAVWFKSPAWNSNDGICGRWGGVTNRQFAIWTSTTSNKLQVNVFAGGAGKNSGMVDSRIYNGQLIGVVATYDRSNLKCFVKLYDDGDLLTDSVAASGDLETEGAIAFTLGSYRSNSTTVSFSGGKIFQSVFSKRAWSDETAKLLLERPFGIFLPRFVLFPQVVPLFAAMHYYRQRRRV